MLQVLHNPRCGKSRNCIAYLKESYKEFEIINYLETPLSVNDLKLLLKKLNLSPLELVRQKEAIWIENYKFNALTDEAIIKALSMHPKLIERPIIVNGDKAIIARELEFITHFL